MVLLLSILILVVSAAQEFNRRDLEHFMLTSDAVSSAVLSIVNTDGILLTHSKNQTVTSKGPLVQMGLISDLLPVIAVLQLVETKRVAMDEPVPLSPELFDSGKAIPTLKDILLHTSGLDAARLTAFSSITDIPDEYFFSTPLVRDAGVVHVYSTHGVAILALIVEELTGLGFQEYVQKHILTPIGMLDTFPLTRTFRTVLESFDESEDKERKPPKPFRLGKDWKYQFGVPRYACTMSDLVFRYHYLYLDKAY